MSSVPSPAAAELHDFTEHVAARVSSAAVGGGEAGTRANSHRHSVRSVFSGTGKLHEGDARRFRADQVQFSAALSPGVVEQDAAMLFADVKSVMTAAASAESDNAKIAARTGVEEVSVDSLEASERRALDGAHKVIYAALQRHENLENAFKRGPPQKLWLDAVRVLIDTCKEGVSTDALDAKSMRLTAIALLSARPDIVHFHDRHGDLLHAASAAVGAWSGKDNPVVLYSIIECILASVDVSLGIEWLKEHAVVSNADPDTLRMLARGIVRGARYPVTACLQVAHVFQTLADMKGVLMEDLESLHVVFTETATNLLNDIESDHLAALVLEQPSQRESAVFIAVKTNNKQFLYGPRLQKCINTMWWRPFWTVTDRTASSADDDVGNFHPSSYSAKPVSYGYLVATMVRHPKRFFRLPIGQFFIEAISYLSLLVLFTLVVYRRDQLGNHFDLIELVAWACMGAFFIGELEEIVDSASVVLADDDADDNESNSKKSISVRLDEYFENGWNQIDFFMYFFTIACAVTRTFAILDETSNGIGEVYPALMAVVIVLVWIRSAYVFSVHATLGPLLIIMSDIIRVVLNFAVLLLTFLLGFSLAMYFLLADLDIQGYTSVGTVCLTLFQAAVGGFDYGVFDDIESKETRITAQLILSGYLTVSLVVLLNLLIALLTTTYDAVQENGRQNFVFMRSRVIWTYSMKNHSLPPPFNIIVLPLYFLFFLFTGRFCCRRSRSVGSRSAKVAAADFIGSDAASLKFERWRCGHCHHKNPSSDTKAMRAQLLAWNKKLEQNRFDSRDFDRIDNQLLVCLNCFRVKKALDEHTLWREKISFWVAALIIFFLGLLLFVCLFVFAFAFLFFRFLVHQAVACTPQVRQQKRDLRATVKAERMVNLSAPWVILDRVRRTEAWVDLHFHQLDPDLNVLKDIALDTRATVLKMSSTVGNTRNGNGRFTRSPSGKKLLLSAQRLPPLPAEGSDDGAAAHSDTDDMVTGTKRMAKNNARRPSSGTRKKTLSSRIYGSKSSSVRMPPNQGLRTRDKHFSRLK